VLHAVIKWSCPNSFVLVLFSTLSIQNRPCKLLNWARVWTGRMIVPKFAVPEANEFRYLNDRVLVLMMKLMLVIVHGHIQTYIFTEQLCPLVAIMRTPDSFSKIAGCVHVSFFFVFFFFAFAFHGMSIYISVNNLKWVLQRMHGWK